MSTMTVPAVPARATAVLRQPLAVGVGMLSVAAGVIHAAVTYEHLQEYLLFGLFFGVVASLQVMWGAAVVVDQRRSVVAAGLVGNLALLALWAVSRTAGLPLGPHHGAEAVATTDIVCALVEALTIVGAGALLMRRLPSRSVSRGAAAGAMAALGVVVAVLMVLSLPGAFGGEHDEHAEHGAETPATAVHTSSMPGMP